MAYFAKNIFGMEHYKIIDSIWFSVNTYHYIDKGEVSTIGIVKAQDTITGEYKVYIGVAKGEDQKEDETFILATGTHFSPHMYEEIRTLNKLRKKD